MLRSGSRFRGLVPAFASGLVLAAVVAAHEYEVTDLDAAGDNGNIAWSLNQHGDVCGWSDFRNSGSEGFLYREGRLRYVGTVQGRSSSNLVAVNNLGHAVGSSGTVYEDPRAFIWLGHKVNLGTLGGDRSWGSGINDLGQAVGSSTLPGNTTTRAFIWENRDMRALLTLGGEHGSADWINNAGQIVGTASIDPNSRQQYGVIWENEQIFQLPPFNGGVHLPRYINEDGDVAGSAQVPVPGGALKRRGVIWKNREVVLQLGTLADGTPFEPIALSTAHAINAHGVIVGLSTNATGDGTVPFVYRDGEMIQLDDLMPEPWAAYSIGPGSINDAGQIVVRGGIPGGTSRALLLTPTVRCPADLDGDGEVNVSDLLMLLVAWGPCPAPCPPDINGDGEVNVSDLLELLAAWGPCP